MVVLGQHHTGYPEHHEEKPLKTEPRASPEHPGVWSQSQKQQQMPESAGCTCGRAGGLGRRDLAVPGTREQDKARERAPGDWVGLPGGQLGF